MQWHEFSIGTGGRRQLSGGINLSQYRNDAGWSQAHYEGIEYVQQQISGVTLEYADKVNPGDRSNVKGSQVADDLIAKGADLIIFNSDDLKDDALETAQKYPNIPVIHASGDSAWQEGQNYQALPNLANVMPKMEYGTDDCRLCGGAI
uniref:Uncharacterized protein n=1 Tax=Desertifilum tharense IPPAS B-1220 TaxID=1781255 RepID=A0ACD5GUM3_9CYAN